MDEGFRIKAPFTRQRIERMADASILLEAAALRIKDLDNLSLDENTDAGMKLTVASPGDRVAATLFVPPAHVNCDTLSSAAVITASVPGFTDANDPVRLVNAPRILLDTLQSHRDEYLPQCAGFNAAAGELSVRLGFNFGELAGNLLMGRMKPPPETHVTFQSGEIAEACERINESASGRSLWALWSTVAARCMAWAKGEVPYRLYKDHKAHGDVIVDDLREAAELLDDYSWAFREPGQVQVRKDCENLRNLFEDEAKSRTLGIKRGEVDPIKWVMPVRRVDIGPDHTPLGMAI